MKKTLCLYAAVIGLSLVAPAIASAQVPYSEGVVERVVLVHINAGHNDAFMADLKANLVPVWEDQKKAGMIVDYHIFLNTTTSGPDDWNLGYSIIYKNMASLDGLADKAYEVRMKHYGDHAAEQKVLDKRAENAHLVNSMLLREITPR